MSFESNSLLYQLRTRDREETYLRPLALASYWQSED